MGHPTDSKRSSSATANCGPYRSINVATEYRPARSHLLHAIANAFVWATTSASVDAPDLQLLHLGGSAAMPHLNADQVAAFRTRRPSVALLPRHDRPTSQPVRAIARPKQFDPDAESRPAAAIERREIGLRA